MSLLFALFSLSTATLPAIMRDPKMFLQSFDTLDPVIVQKMITMVDQLIADGEVERQGHVDRQNQAQSRFDTATADEHDATVARDEAAGKVKNQQDVVNAASLAEQSAKDIRTDKKRILDAAIVDEKMKADFRASEIKRIDAEKELMQQIVAKLESLLPGVDLIEGKLTVTDYIVGRNLLADSGADRDSVQKVVDKVNAMVGRGEQQRVKVIKDDEDAKAFLVKATAEHKDAVAKHDAAVTVLSTEEGTLDKLETDLAGKESVLVQARAELKDATEDLAKKIQVRTQEDIRLDDERATCEQILEILHDLKSRAQ